MPPPRHTTFIAVIGTLALATAPLDADTDVRDALWAAVRNADADAAKALIDKGADVNAANEIGITALWIAAGKDKPEVVTLLLEAGADANARDKIWYQTPLSIAVGGRNEEIVTAVLKAGAMDVDANLAAAARAGTLPIVQALLDIGKPGQDALDAALFAATGKEEISEALKKAGAEPLKSASEDDRERWQPLAGTYEHENGSKLTVEVTDTGLVVRRSIFNRQPLKPVGPDAFSPLGEGEMTYTFERRDGSVYRLVRRQSTSEVSLYRSEARPVAEPTNPPAEPGDVRPGEPINWPSLRGPDGSGVADGQHPPITWDVETGKNVRWKTPIPGLGHSAPIVWGDRVFVTTAISSGEADPKVRTGNYGDVASVNDTSEHTWQVLCLNRKTGEILWTRTAHKGVPKIKRHLKGSQANCTPATDGKRVVACFGPEGLYCYDFAGELLWKRDLSTIDSSFAMDREYEWGFAASPVIYEGLVIVQFDLSKDSFIAAYSLEDGSRVWSTPRDEIPSWSSPVIWKNAERTELVTNASQFARGYDPKTGKELWRLAKKSEATIPMPVIGEDTVFITSGNRPIQPIFAVRPGAAGDISLPNGEDHSDSIAWSKLRGGPYMMTPIFYRGHLYVGSNAGMLTCYDPETGEERYERERIGGVSYTASPVAADGRIYFVSEQGSVRVVKSGPEFELLAVNEIDDVCMATPAISGGTLFVRSQHYLFAFGRDRPEN